jgi:hypothetical protein
VLNPGDTIVVTVRTQLRGNPLPPPFFPDQGLQAACEPGGPTLVENIACVQIDGGSERCAEAQMVCEGSVSSLPATGETSTVSRVATVAGGILAVLLLLAAVTGGVIWRRRRYA